MSISVATGSHRFVCGVRLFRGLQGKQRGGTSDGLPAPPDLQGEPTNGRAGQLPSPPNRRGDSRSPGGCGETGLPGLGNHRALLAFVAHRVLADRAVAITADSPSLARSELEEARAFARAHGIHHRVVATTELKDPRYARNAANRCFFCKESLMEALLALPEAAGSEVLLGVNVDDLGDHRPYQTAALRQGARFPLVEAGLSKADVRSVSRTLGLPTWDKPAAACLASRIAYGVPVTEGALRRVERSEDALRVWGSRGGSGSGTREGSWRASKSPPTSSPGCWVTAVRWSGQSRTRASCS